MAARADILEKVKKDRQAAEQRVQQSQTKTSAPKKTVNDYRNQRIEMTTPKTKWYSGEKPTSRETLARIYEIGKTDKAKSNELMGQYKTLQSDPNSAYYNPYISATTSKATKTNVANTLKAQDEWTRLSEELSYWATRTDRNYSDDEIISRINWDNYKTLQEMDEGRVSGSPMALLEGVGYSKDAMYGVLWSARNPGASTGNAMYDAVQGALGRGNAYVRDDQTAERLNPMSPSYNPYVVGSTMDDMAYTYRTDRFDEQWLEENRSMLLNPETAADYGKIYNAVQNTNAMREEAEALKAELASYAETGTEPDFGYLLSKSEYKTLAKMQESLKSGQIMDTAYGIDFDLPTLMAEAAAAYQLKQAKLNAAKDPDALQTVVDSEKTNFIERGVEWWGSLFKDAPSIESETMKPDTVYDESPAASLSKGMLWAGATRPSKLTEEQRRLMIMSGELPPEEASYSDRDMASAIENGDYTSAAAMNYEDTKRKIEEDPELLTTDMVQKSAMASLSLVATSPNPEDQAAAEEYAKLVEASMGMDTGNEVYKFFDEAMGGALSETKDNEGLPWWKSMAMAIQTGGDKFNDVWANVVGAATTVYGYAIEGTNKVMNWFGIEGEIPMAKKLQEAGTKIGAHYDQKLAQQDQFMRENATTWEYISYAGGSEAVKMAGMGAVAKGIGAIANSADKVVTALEANKLGTAAKMLTMSPFVAESASADFQESMQNSEDFLTATLSAAITGFATLATSDVGVMKNIEKMGRPILEVVDTLSAVPGAGLKAATKRWGKGMLMYLGNLIKTGVNEGFQEVSENLLSTAATAGIKGEEFKLDRSYAAELTRDAIMGAIGSFSSSIGVFPDYTKSVAVANANQHKSVLTPADVQAQVQAFVEDMNDPEVVDAAKTAAAELAVGMRTGELVAEGALPEVDTKAVDAATQKVAEADTAAQVASEAVARADEKFKANMADDAAANELMKAIDEQANAQNAADEAHAELAQAQAEYETASTAAMDVVREQARAEVTQNMAAAQEARMQQETAAEVKRQSDNVLAMQADDFVNTYFADANEEQKKVLRERYISNDGQAQNATRSMVEFAGQISKKFGLSVKFTDSHGIFEGAYTGGNQIVLDKNATQGDVIKRVLVHEITHAAENSKSYDALADAVLEAYYEGNQEQIKADINEKAKQYAETVGQEGETIARSELVADRLAEMLSGDQKAMDRLVAEKPDVATRIWRAIKEFIGKLTGVKNSELDKYIQLEKKLEKALNSRTGVTSGTQFMIERGAGGVDVVVVDEDILDGVTLRDWPKVVRSVMASRFPDGVPVGNNVIRINRDTRKEVTNSKDTMWLKHNDFSAYQDKLRATANSDEIIKASRDYVNEAPAHERKDRIVDFARGEVSMRIGGKEYDAEVVVGYDLDGSMRLYDFVRMTRTDEKKAGQPFEDESSRDSHAGLSELSVSENGSLVKQVSDGTEIIRGGATKFSLTSWTEKEKTEVRKNLIQNGYGPANVDKWIADVNSVAAIIAGDKARLDYKAANNQVMLKNNQEYVKTLDASTLCAKRLLYQGTFNEIQHMLPNTVLTSEDLLHLSDMMNQAGLETPCGVCYVESRRRHLGKYAQDWLDSYEGEYKPTLDEVTTTDGLENLRVSRPEVYKSFVDAMNAKGSANPKVVQLRTDYRGDIRNLTKGEIKKIIEIGGLRVQSFSDFETPHLIDMMQAVLDMSAKNLPAQAYTKVPNFAWVFGDTGIKINLSLLAEGNGLNEDGTLKFSSKEGMDIDEALRLRERYSENVGTILVGVSEEHIRAAMADPRIDYIIPFHKSGWGQNELNLLPVLNSYDNFEAYQNERTIVGYHKNGKPKYGKPKGGNFYPIDYWDYSKTGDENSVTYLRMCEEDGRVPKFEQFLTKDADGHWVAPSGYWKMLIDFKMYNNDGLGAPQQAVQPTFNMEEAVRVLDDYEGGADTLPVAWGIVDQFVAEKKKAAAPGTRFSLPSNDILDQRIAQHRNSQLASAPNDIIPSGREPEQNYGTGERQFAGQTIQNSAAVPDWIKQEFLRPEELNYEVDTNREQVERSWQRIQENGYEAERDRLLSLDRYSADDTAEANLMMAMALREDTADPATFMALASHYNKEGTKAGQELQARKLFTRMSPTGARVWAAGQMESRLEDHMRTHQPQRRRIDENARRVADQIRDMQSGDEILRLNAGGDFTIDESNNRWGVPINEQQQALIDHYGLNNVARPGIFYNRATTQQRMLEAILATPNPLEVTGLGLNLIQRLEFMQDGEAVITNADLNYIGTQLGQFVAQGGDEGGREADLAVSRAYEAYGNITPSTTREKLRTWRYVSMLFSIPSAIRNVIGNTSQNVVNATAHGLAVELDKAIARATGQRTVEHLNYQERINGWRGFVEETQSTFRDYFIDRSVTQRGNDKYNTNQRGRVYQTQFIETMRNMEGFLMSFGDRNMWRKAYLNSMAEQQKLADRNLLFNADGTTRTHEQMLEQAEADANYATFTEDNAVSNVLSQLKNIPGVGEVIDFIMPFTGVPTNITRRMIQYSPIGLAATALRHGYRAATHQNFDQRAFVDGISRGLTGTALFGVGMLLAAAGVIKPGTGDEDDDKKYGLKTAMGGQYTPYVYNPLTDEYVSLAAFAPAASPLTMGLTAYEEFKANDDALQALISASFSGADQIFDASYMSGVQDIFKGYGSPAENIVNTVFSNAVSQSVPALLTQLSNTIDPYVRDTKDKNAIVQALKSGLINRIPGLRQMLPEKVDVTGQTVRTKEGLRNFYDPFTTTDARKDPAVDELFRLSDSLGSSKMLPSDALSGSKMTLSINSQKVTVDAKGKETYRKRYGELWLEGGTTIDKKGRPVVVEGVRNLINSSAYRMMDDEERADAIADILSESKTGAAMEALNKYGAD